MIRPDQDAPLASIKRQEVRFPPLRSEVLTDWHDGAIYSAIARLDRGGLALQCLLRNPQLSQEMSDGPATTGYVLRTKPRLLVLADADDGAALMPWGLHFRPSTTRQERCWLGALARRDRSHRIVLRRRARRA